MVIEKDYLITELFRDNKKICVILLSNNIKTLNEIKKLIYGNKYINRLKNPDRLLIKKRLIQFENNNYIINRNEIDDNLKNIFIEELDLSNIIKGKLLSNNINTFNDLHYIIDRNLIEYLSFFTENNKNILKDIYYKVIMGERIINRVLTDEEINISNKYHYININSLKFESKMKTCFYKSNILTLGDLTNYILKNQRIRYLDKKLYEVLIKEYRDVINNLRLLNKDNDKSLVLINK